MDEKTISSRKIYKGRILDLELIDVEVDGMATKREVVRHAGAVAVLARISGADFVFVQQFRKPVECEVFEIAAGILEKGEDPEHAAARELKEETGHEVMSLIKLGVIWPSPGYTDELLHLFFAELSTESSGLLLDEDEKLEVVYRSEEEVENMISCGDVRDAKTLVAWMLWKGKLED